MSKQWFGGEWMQGEMLLTAENEKGEPRPLETVLDGTAADVIVLTNGGVAMGGLFDTIDDADDWKRDELLRWARAKNRSDKWHVWTKADADTEALVKAYHNKCCVVAVLIRQERTYWGEWEKTLGTKIVLDRMKKKVDAS